MGSFTNTNVAIANRISTGPTVHASSSRFAPWICAPSASRGRLRRRYRITNATRRISTSRKIAKTNAEMKRKLCLIAWAFGDSGVTGVKPPLPARAVAVATSGTTSAPTMTRGFGLTVAGIL